MESWRERDYKSNPGQEVESAAWLFPAGSYSRDPGTDLGMETGFYSSPHSGQTVGLTYLVSLLPICCLSSSLSSSVCLGRMFFSSSSRLEGLLLSLMAKESFLHTFMAREAAGGRKDSLMLMQSCLCSSARLCYKVKGRKADTTGLIAGSGKASFKALRVSGSNGFYKPRTILCMRSTRGARDWVPAPQEPPTGRQHHRGGLAGTWGCNRTRDSEWSEVLKSCGFGFQDKKRLVGVRRAEATRNWQPQAARCRGEGFAMTEKPGHRRKELVRSQGRVKESRAGQSGGSLGREWKQDHSNREHSGIEWGGGRLPYVWNTSTVLNQG